jgi:hypothetical protein
MFVIIQCSSFEESCIAYKLQETDAIYVTSPSLRLRLEFNWIFLGHV